VVIRVSRTCLAGTLVVAVGGVLLFSVTAPTVVDGNGEDSAAMFVKAALWAYKDQNGHVPRDFVDVLPFLNRMARSDCSINKLERDRYQVRVNARQRIYDIEVEYIGDPDTNTEEYHVLDIRHHPIGKHSSGRAE